MTTVYTIGFAGKSLEDFVGLLKNAGVTRLIDIRLRPGSQLSGYARQADLRYVLEHYEGIEYVHAPDLAPTAELLDAYRASKDWAAYEAGYEELIESRGMVSELQRLAEGHTSVAVLCSEAKPDKCHRRLVAEAYTRQHASAAILDL